MVIMALLVIPALVMEQRALTPQVRTTAVALNWIIWVAFCGEFTIRWAADGKASFPRRAWFDLLLIVVTPPFGVPGPCRASEAFACSGCFGCFGRSAWQ